MKVPRGTFMAHSIGSEPMPKVSRPRRHGARWQINWLDGAGRRHFKTYASYKVAQAALVKVKAEALAVQSGEQEAVPDKRWEDLETLFETMKAGKRSLKDDKSRMRLHLRPAFGGLRLVEIDEVRIGRFSAALLQRVKRKQLKVGTVRLILALLKSMLNVALETRWIRRVPSFKLPPPEDKPYCWIETDDGIARFLRAAREETYPGLFELYATAIYTGLRAGELTGLQWKNVDLENRLITVERTRDQATTKGGRTRRVPVLDPLLPVLSGWRDEEYDLELVFCNLKGGMFRPDARPFKQTFHRVRERAGLPRMTFHDLRHTFASHWMLKGGDIYRLQKILGHRSVTTTERYAHMAPAAFREDWDRFPDLATGDGS